ncbi:MAG: hypothetical protein WD991_00635 [Candidatus Paceibacterota bacterium]
MNWKNNKGGFLQIIFIIVVALLLMKFFGFTISGTIAWFKEFFGSVLQ